VAQSSRPLDNFPLVRTRQTEELRKVFARVYAAPTMELARPDKKLNAIINYCQIQDSCVGFGTYGADVCLEFPAVDYFLQLFPIQGKGEIVCRKAPLPMKAGTSATISPDYGYKASYSADYEQLILKFDAQALTRKLAAITEADINEPLRIDPQVDFSLPTARALYEYIPLLANTLSSAAPPLPAWWTAQTEQLLMVLFLCGHRHNYSYLLERDVPDAAPWQIRRAEEYIEANWRQPIALEDLARVAGVSAFSLFRSFKKARGYSPLEYIAQVRAKYGGMR
jgi:hypothetical protein